jgi:hypothetical protein
MCGSSPATSLKYFYDFDGDGNDDFQGPFCSQTRTYKVKSVEVFPAISLPGPAPLKSTTWTVRGCAEPRNPDVVPQEKRCQTGTVTVEEAPTTTTTLAALQAGNAGTQRLSWSSQLDVAAGSGQVVVNSAATVFSGGGRSNAIAEGRSGSNRVEATLVEGAGKPGTWRFEFGATPSFKVGSLRVIAGEVAVVTGDAVTFKLKGTPGERLVFAFETAH